jgi:glycosyltransferase involved in cell wall biosynthesis
MLENWKCDFVSVYPNRFSRTLQSSQPKKWKQFKVMYLSMSRKYPSIFFLRILQVFAAYVSLIGFILFQSKKYDALYFYNPRWADSLGGLILASWLGKKIVVDQTELFSTGKNHKLHRSEEKIVAKRASELLVISNRLKEHFSKLKTGKIHLYPIMVDFERFNVDRAEIKGMLGYIGSFGGKDGIETILEGFKTAQKEISYLKLRLIGYNAHPEKLEALIDSFGIAEHVEVTGTVTFKQIPWLLQECDTLVMNRDGSEFATYGYPIKLGEYFACNKPVLMSDGQGFAEDFNDLDQVYKYDVDNPRSLANKMTYRYHNLGESDAVAKRGYQYARDYFDGRKLGIYLVNVLNSIK